MQSDNAAADSRVAVVITKCTLEVQQFADKGDDCCEHMQAHEIKTIIHAVSKMLLFRHALDDDTGHRVVWSRSQGPTSISIAHSWWGRGRGGGGVLISLDSPNVAICNVLL